MPSQVKVNSSNLIITSALQAFDSQKLFSRVVTDNGKIIHITRKEIPKLINQGYLLRHMEHEKYEYYLSFGLPGGSPLDELERKLNNKRAEQRSVFITYQWAQQEIAKKLQTILEAKGFLVIRDEDNLLHNAYLPGFMKIINDRNVDYVLPIISKSYLKSKNCMYEVNQILNRPHWEKRLLPYVVTEDKDADAKIYGGIDPYITHWQQEFAQTNDEDYKEIVENILRNLKPFTQAIVTKINIAESELIFTNYQALFNMINAIEEEEHSFKFREIHELLRKAAFNEKLEEIDDARVDYEAALAKVKEMSHLPSSDLVSGQVHGLYGAFLLSQDNDTDKKLGEKYKRIAKNFGYPPASPANFSDSASNNNSSSSSTIAPLNPGFQNFVSYPSKEISAVDVTRLLYLVAAGEQEQAETMIDTEPDLLYHRGEVTDLSGRKFENITAFQYAVWALDWHMWKMIQNYLPVEEQQTQAKEFRTGDWVKNHDVTATKIIQNLINALQRDVESCNKYWREDTMKRVGAEQLCLPIHVINEYCRPDRSFAPTTNFLESPLPRTRIVAMNLNGSLRESDWFSSELGGRNGCAAYRGKGNYCSLCNKLGTPDKEFVEMNLNSVLKLLDVRTNQHSQLVASLRNITKLNK